MARFGFELHQALGLEISEPQTTRATQNLTSLASHSGGHASFAVVVVGTDRPHEVLSMVEGVHPAVSPLHFGGYLSIEGDEDVEPAMQHLTGTEALGLDFEGLSSQTWLVAWSEARMPRMMCQWFGRTRHRHRQAREENWDFAVQEHWEESTPSKWVLEKLKEFGIVLGASYEGFEEEIMCLLKCIEDKRNQQPCQVADQKGLNKEETTSGLKFAADGCLKERIVVELEKTNLLKEISWRQKSHPATITQYYNCLYTEEVEWRLKLDGLEFSMIFTEDVAWLNKPFDEEEVARVVKGFNGDKALGPDGFPMAFFQFVGILFV
uniref:Uncharacterized protein n=1 Tax=Fagus sylvatica TaxID=28930 RepID=A0A2N9E244_FAGSY